jgi:hypothetical protein
LLPLSVAGVNETSNNTLNNINYFSNENNPDNNEGSNSSSTINSDDENNSDNNEGSNGNPNNNNRDAMEVDDIDSNSDNESNPDDPENIEEVPDPEHNAPERIVDDLDVVEKAKNNDPEALEYLKREYSDFFDNTSENEALNQIKEYLEDEFPKELKRSEHEADALKAKENAEDIQKEIDELEKEEKETTDPQIKENLSTGIGALKDRVQEELEKAEKSTRKSY